MICCPGFSLVGTRHLLVAMDDSEKVTKGIEAAKTMLEKLEKAFNELESRREASLPNKTQWADIKEHFNNLEKSLKEKLDQVEEKKRVLNEKQSESRRLIAEREAAVAAKELDSLNRLQELKDDAVSAITEACKNCKAPTPMLVDVKESTDHKVSTSANDEPNADNKSGNPAELRPQLKELCQKMDAKGLLKVLSGNRKLLTTIGEELSTALKSAVDPARLVLDSLEGFYPLDPSNSQESDDALQMLRRTSIVVMEAATPLLGAVSDHQGSSEIKQQAKTIADEWKAKLAGVDIDASYGFSLEAVAFLQLLVTFSIAEEFHEDELCKLVLAVSRRRQAPELCRSLGLIHRMPGLVENLVKTGRQIDAVHFAHAFQLTESFPPVPLLKEYLDNVMGNTQENTGNKAAGDRQKEFNSREMGALRVIIKCIEEYKLQEEYPVEPLKKRVARLEKAKYVKKRLGQKQAAKSQQAKKPHTNSGYVSRKPAVPMPVTIDNRQVPPLNYDERGIYPTFSERHQESYAYPGHPSYVQQPYSAQRPYPYMDERVAPPAPYNSSMNYGMPNYGATSYENHGGTTGHPSSTPNSYENYMGTLVQSATPNYGSYTGAQSAHPSYIQ